LGQKRINEKGSKDLDNIFPVIGIGASAGGLDAFSTLLDNLRLDTGAAYVLIQHLSPKTESQLSSILSRRTTMTLTEITDKSKIEPNHIYISPPGSIVTISRGALKLKRFNGNRHPETINQFFISLADEMGPKAVGVILSGTGSDGIEGLRTIKEKEGVTIAQDPGTAQFPEMPENAIAAGVIDHVHPIMQISEQLSKIIQNLNAPVQPTDEETTESQPLNKIFNVLRNRFGVDFAHYKKPTFNRRLHKRMALHRIENLEEYASLIDRDSAEVESLYNEVLLNVTSFFRNPRSFDALVEKAFSRIIEKRAPDDVIKVWVPGCSTGEEVYSLAILFLEFFNEKKTSPKLMIYATDIDENALNIARVGLYSKEIAKHVSAERLGKFFDEKINGYKICKKARDLCVFSRHDLTSDPPFAHISLVSCRNTLIYIEEELQRLILQGFHYALSPNGVLLLGNSETTGRAIDLFSVIDRKYKIYFAKMATLRPDYRFPKKTAFTNVVTNIKRKPTNVDPLDTILRRANEIVLSEYAPAGVVVNEDLEILQFNGKIGRILEPTPGAPSFNLMKMFRKPLSLNVRVAFEKAKRENKTVAGRSTLDENGAQRIVNFEVRPFNVHQSTERFFIILIRDSTDSVQVTEGEPPMAPADSINELEGVNRELAETQEYLKTYMEEQEATIEEFNSTFEELQSNFEELQSTSEELETAKEELQTSNEEMNTLNTELQSRNLELDELNNDLNNLISSVQIPIVMVGNDKRIRRITPLADRVLGVSLDDVGRLVGDLNLRIVASNMEQMISDVMNDRVAHEVEVKGREGRWFSLRINPYLTSDDKIDGVVISLVDVDDLKRSQLKALDAERYADNIVETIRHSLLVLDLDLRVVSANRSFYKLYSLSSNEVEGKLLYELDDNRWDIPELRMLLEQVLPLQSSFEDFEIDHVHPNSGRQVLRLNGRQVVQKDKGRSLILLTLEDITKQKVTEEVVVEARDYLDSLLTNANAPVIVWNSEHKITRFSPAFENLSGYTGGEVLGKEMSMLFPSDTRDETLSKIKQNTEGKLWKSLEIPILCKSGEVRVVLWNSANIYGKDGATVIATIAQGQDITERRKMEENLRASEDRYRSFLDNLRDAVFVLDDNKYLYANKAAADMLGYDSPEDIMNLPSYSIVSPEEREMVRQRTVARARGKVAPNRYELRLLRRDGGVVQVELNVSRIMYMGRSASLAVHRDITEQKHYEQRLEILLRHSIELAHAYTVDEITELTLNLIEKTLNYNQCVFGVVEGKMLRFSNFQGIDGVVDIPLDGRGITVRAARTGMTQLVSDVRLEEDYIDGMGEKRFEILSELAVPVKFGDEVVAVIDVKDKKLDAFTSQDQKILEIFAEHVSSRLQQIRLAEREREAQLRVIEEKEKTKQAKHLTELKTEFIGTATHEIRTPLTSIRGYTELIKGLLDAKTDPKLLTYFEAVTRNADRLQRLSDDLLDMHRIETGRLTILREPLNIQDLLELVEAEMAPLLSRRKQVLEVSSPPIQVYGDTIRLIQVLVNLIGNASRLSAENAVVKLYVVDSDGEVIVSVEDNGVGIRAEDIPKLFKPFPDIHVEGVSRGSGLGLSISFGIVELHGGRIWVESGGPGRGSTFSFTLPKNVR